MHLRSSGKIINYLFMNFYPVVLLILGRDLTNNYFKIKTFCTLLNIYGIFCRNFKFDSRALKDLCPERDGENICPACPKV